VCLREKAVALFNGTFLGQQLCQVWNKKYTTTTISGTTSYVLTINESALVSLITRTEMVLEHGLTWHSVA